MAQLRKFFPALLLLGAALSAFSIKQRANEPGPQKQAEYRSSLSDINVLNIVDGRTLWSATSKKAVFSGDGGTASLSGVAINIPAENAQLTATGGQYDMDTGMLSLTGEINSRVKGFDVKTSSMQIVPGGKLNTGSNDMVLLRKKGIMIQGRGLEANQKKNVRLDRNVKAIFY